MLSIPGRIVYLDWKMFSYGHWSRRANADNTRQMRWVGGIEA